MDMEGLQKYLKDYNVEEMVLELTEALLKDKPADLKPYILAKLKEQQEGGGIVVEKDGGSTATDAMSEIGGHHLIRLFESTRSITAEIVPKETINIIIQETIKLLKCDRVSLFVHDRKINMLVLNASNLSTPIRVAPGQGIAGHVFSTQETVNIPDCYTDDRFDPGFDKKTGYYTKSLLTMPILDFEGEPIGVLQAINKENHGEFNSVDELLLGHLTQHAGIALRNAEVYRDAIISSERANGLLHMVQSLSQDLGIQSMILTITMHANELVQADRCTVFLVDEAKGQLWSVSTDSGKEIRIPKTAGIAGECACQGKLINIPDAYEDPRFNQEVDKKTGYHTKSILAVPVFDDHQKRILAVIQMINKKDFDEIVGTYTEDDVQIMETFAKFVGSKLAASNLVAEKKSQGEGTAAFGAMDSVESHRDRDRQNVGTLGGAIMEDAEEEEDS